MCFRSFFYRLAIVSFAAGNAAPSSDIGHRTFGHAEIGVNVRGQFAPHRRLVRSEDSQNTQAIELVDPEQASLENSAFEHLLNIRDSDRELALVKPHIVEHDTSNFEDSRNRLESVNGGRRTELQTDEVEKELATQQADAPSSRLRPEQSQDMDQYRKSATRDDRVFMSSDASPDSLRSKRALIEPREQESRSIAGRAESPIELAVAANSEEAPSSDSSHINFKANDVNLPGSDKPSPLDMERLPQDLSSSGDGWQELDSNSNHMATSSRNDFLAEQDDRARAKPSQSGSDQLDDDTAGSLDNAMRTEPPPSLSTEAQLAEEQLDRKTDDRIQDTSSAATFAASEAAERIVSQSSSAERVVSIEAAANAAASAAVTAARVAESLPANLPEEVRKAALKAAATAAAKATLASQGTEFASTSRASLQTKPATKTEQLPKGETSGNIPKTHEKAKDAHNGLQRHGSSQHVQKPQLPQSHRRDVHQAASSSMMGGNGQSIETADHAEAPDQEKLLYIGVFSQTGDFEQRTNVRRAWVSKLREQYGESGNVLVEFIIGHQPHNAQGEETDHDAMLEREHEEHADLFHVPYEESPVQVLMFFAHAVEMRYRFALKIDIDRELLYQPLIKSLQREGLGKLLYAGQNLHDASLLDVADQKIQKYFAGPCYLASWSLAQRISKAHLDHSIMLWSYNTDGADVDDMDMGKWVSWEDRMFAQMAEDRRKQLEKVGEDGDVVAQRVDYRIMDICRPLPPPEIRFKD